MAVEVTDEGAALASGLLQVVQVLPGAAVGPRIDGLGQHVQMASTHLMKGHEELIAEIVDQGVGRAPRAQGAASVLLAGAEESLQLVGRGRQAGIIEAVEQARAVAASDADQMVDEGGGLGVEAHARRGALELQQEVPQLGLGSGGVLGPVDSIRSGAEVMGYVSEVLHMSVDPTGEPDLMPVQVQRLRERIKARGGHRGTVGVFFFWRFRRYGGPAPNPGDEQARAAPEAPCRCAWLGA